jgi:hypothetical protein
MPSSFAKKREQIAACREVARRLIEDDGPFVRKDFRDISTDTLRLIMKRLIVVDCIQESVVNTPTGLKAFQWEVLQTGEAKPILQGIADEDVQASTLLFHVPQEPEVQKGTEIEEESAVAEEVQQDPLALIAEVLQGFSARIDTSITAIAQLTALVVQQQAEKPAPASAPINEAAAEMILDAITENTEVTKSLLGKTNSLAMAVEVFTMRANSVQQERDVLREEIGKRVDIVDKALVGLATVIKQQQNTFAVCVEAMNRHNELASENVAVANSNGVKLGKYLQTETSSIVAFAALSENTRRGFNEIISALSEISRGREIAPYELTPISEIADATPPKPEKANSLPSLHKRTIKKLNTKLADTRALEDNVMASIPPSIRNDIVQDEESGRLEYKPKYAIAKTKEDS